MKFIDDYFETIDEAYERAMSPTIPVPPPVRRAQAVLQPGDYIIGIENIPALDGTDDMIVEKGKVYRVVNSKDGWVETTDRKGCQITKTAFERCHLQIVKND